MYCKRILILQQSDSRFAERRKELCGMVKLVNNTPSNTDVTVFVANADVAAFGEWWVLLCFGRDKLARQLTSLNNAAFTVPRKKLDNVGCLLVKREDKCYEAARSYSGDSSVCDVLRRHMENLVLDSAQYEESATAYEQFVASTDDYYAGTDVSKLRNKADERYKSVAEYSSAFERYYASGGTDDYYDSVKTEISKVFMQFPPYYPLIRKYVGSFFVRIDFPKTDKFFVLGVLQNEGKIRYICYGLPAEQEGFSDKDFVYIENAPVSFWMLFQDAGTGQISALNETV
ncbi:MAG: hypothetical protein NC332_03565 [Firmicutes bacterium]|nr:hypothetical protein [Bacillota bacterium]